MFLSINYTDRFLFVLHDVDRKWLQLPGAVAIWTASRYEEARRTSSIYTIRYAAANISKEVYPATPDNSTDAGRGEEVAPVVKAAASSSGSPQNYLVHRRCR